MAISLISTLAAALIGAFCWRNWWSIGFAFAIPILVGLQSRRAWAFAVSIAYFASASWPLVGAYAAFSGTDTISGPSTWILAATLLSLPLTAAWAQSRTAAAWRIPTALAASVLPPLGLIGWASPVTSAGALFPGTAWLGLSAVILTPAFVLLRSRRIWIGIAVGSIICHCFSKPVPPPLGWAPVQTSLAPGRRLEGADEWLASTAIQKVVSESSAAVTILPEMVISRWTEATEAFWETTLNELNRQRRLAVIGAGVAIRDESAYENAAMVIGGEKPQAFFQRVPVPVGLWRPFGNDSSLPLRMRRPGTIEIAGQRVAILICYEQLLVLPMLLSALETPTLIVGISNHCWVRQTDIPASQRAALTAWSRLFALPMLVAENK